MVRLPSYHVLNYVYDNDGGSVLTVLVNGERYHVTVDAKDLKDRSKAGKKIRQEYQRLLHQVQADASGEEATHQTAPLFVQEDEAESSDDKDSGVDVTSSHGSEKDHEHDAGPSESLQRWILKPLASAFSSSTSPQKELKKRTVQDWYYCATHFYHLTIFSGKLSAVQDEPSETLNKRVDHLIPTINLPKYIQKLNVPSYVASDVTVLAEAEGPAGLPIHPTLVECNGKQYFLKAVNNAEPGPTKREIQVMKKIEQEGLQNELRVPLLRGLVRFDGNSSSTKMMGFLLDAISEPTPLTKMLDPSVPEEKRNRWAEESARMVDVLHQHNIIWGDSKGDNFMVDANEDLWIIDFGGSYTEGWIDPELKDSEEGDDQGVRRLVSGLKDPVNGTTGGDDDDDDDEDEEEVMEQEEEQQAEGKPDKGDRPEEVTPELPPSLKRKHRNSAEEERADAKDRAAKQQKRCEDNVDEAHMPFTTEGIDQDDEKEDEEPKRYCYCDGPDAGRMLACDGDNCDREWFHFKCVGIDEAPKEKKWYCMDCITAEE